MFALPSPTPAAPTDSKNNAVSIIGKIIAGVVLAVVVLAVIVLVLVGVAGPGFVQSAIAGKTGFAVHSQKFAINPLGGSVELQGFAIDNPAEFGGGSFVTIPEFVVNADLVSFLSQPYHVKELTLHVERTWNIHKDYSQLLASYIFWNSGYIFRICFTYIIYGVGDDNILYRSCDYHRGTQHCI